MNFGKRALLSVLRRKGKSLILFAVIFILGNIIAGAIAIQQSTENVEKKIKKDLGAVATVDYDYENMMEISEEDANEMENLSEKKINEIGGLSYVKEYDYSASSYLELGDFSAISYDYGNEGGETVSDGSMDYVLLEGTNKEEPIDFSNKTVSLTEGRFFSKEELENGTYGAIISAELASENSLTVGDEMVLDAVSFKHNEDGGSERNEWKDFRFKVIGIFKAASLEKSEDDDKNKSLASSMMYLETDQLNTIYLPNKAVDEISQANFEREKEQNPGSFVNSDGSEMEYEDNFYAIPTYILNDPEDVEPFKEEVLPLLPKFFKVTASSDKYDEVAGSIQKLSNISGYVVIAAVVASLLIISLMVVLFLRDRNHELGIYLSLGESRKKVLAQIMLELLMISAVAMGLSLFTGNILGKTVSDSLLQSDILADNSSNGADEMFFMNTVTSNISLTAEDVQEAYSVDFTASYFIVFMLVGLATVLGSAALPLLYVMRLNPKKILM